MLHGHGDDGYKYKQKITANFSTNIWYGSPCEQLTEHLSSKLDVIQSYPEVLAERFVSALAQDVHVDKKMILAVNGSTEAFYLIAQYFKNATSTIIIPTFSEYEDACKINEHAVKFLNWTNLSASSKFCTKLVWICNPNNPGGEILHKHDFFQILQRNLNSYFIVDEAYIDFTDKISSSVDLLKSHQNLIVVKSMTKNFAIPGLRLGYLVANQNLVRNMKRYKAPWSVNSLAIEAGIYLIQHKNQFLPPVSSYQSNVKEFISKLSDIEFLKIHSTNTSYFLVELQKGNATELKNYLISKFGILIRDASNFRGLNSSYIRIACLSKEKNQLLINALQAWSKLN